MSIITKQFGQIITKHGSKYMLVASGWNSNRLRMPTWRKIAPQDGRAEPTSLIRFGRKYNVLPQLGTQNLAVCDQLNCNDSDAVLREIRIQTLLPITSADDPNTGVVTLGFDINGLGDVRSLTSLGRALRQASHSNLSPIAPVVASDSSENGERIKTIGFSINSLPEIFSPRRMRVRVSPQPRFDVWVLPSMAGVDPVVVNESDSETEVRFDITTLPYA